MLSLQQGNAFLKAKQKNQWFFILCFQEKWSFSSRETPQVQTPTLTNGSFTQIFWKNTQKCICTKWIGFHFWTLLTLDFAGSKNYFSLFLGTRVEFSAPNGKVEQKTAFILFLFILSRMKNWAAISHPFWKKDCHRVHPEQQSSRHSSVLQIEILFCLHCQCFFLVLF